MSELNRQQIQALVPHAGRMCLIDQVVTWDADHIHCRAHIDDPARHPLTANGRLPATALAEFGAQAMAVHGGISGATPARAGLLAGLGRLRLNVDAIDTPATLDIHVRRQGGDDRGLVCAFEVFHAQQLLAGGQATIMFPEDTA